MSDGVLTLQAHGHQCVVSPDRWGMITALSLDGVSMLYMDQQTLADPQASVRWGVPILFPNAWELDPEAQKIAGYSLARHGFARSVSWSVVSQTTDTVCLQIVSTPETRSLFPYDFVCTQTVHLDPRGLKLTVVVHNTSAAVMPLAFGLHPYFPLSRSLVGSVVFDCAGGSVLSARAADPDNDLYAQVPNPVCSLETPIRFFLPDIGWCRMFLSPEYRFIRLWNPPGRPSVCIEPFMRDEGGLIDDPFLIPAWHSIELVYRLEHEGF